MTLRQQGIIRHYGNMAIWQYGNMAIWDYGTKE